MKLHKLVIKNFRGLQGDKNIIDFSNSSIIFLIGQNNVGKSSFLRAYEYFVGTNFKPTIEDFTKYDISNSIEIEGWFYIETTDSSNTDFTEPDRIRKWGNSENIVKIRKTRSNIGQSGKKQTFDPQQNNRTDGGFGGFDTLFTKYSPTPIFINAMETEDSLEEKVNELINDSFLKKAQNKFPTEYESAITAIKELQNKVISSEEIDAYKTNINANFQKTFSGLSLNITPKGGEIKLADTLKKDHSIEIAKDGEIQGQKFKSYGHGVIRQALFNFIAFLQGIGSTQKKYIILFEEPELFLHPKISFLLRKVLYELALSGSQYQILCATHSSLMIDISKPHSSIVRITKDQSGNTQTIQVDETLFQSTEEMKKFTQMVNRFNPHICEAFYASKIILVEGDTEAIVYRYVLDQSYPNEEIFVLNTGSKTNIPFFQDILNHFQIPYYVIHDLDSPRKSDGTVNGIFTINKKISEKLCLAGKRFFHNPSFELANGYSESAEDGKPLSAFKFVSNINNLNTCDLPFMQIIRRIIANDIGQTQEEIDILFS